MWYLPYREDDDSCSWPIINPEQTGRNRIYLPASCLVPLWQGFRCPNMMGVTTGPYVRGLWAYVAVLEVNYRNSNTIMLEIPWFIARAVTYHLSPSTALSCNPRSPHPYSTMHPIGCTGYTRESLSRDLRKREQWLRVQAIHVLTSCHGHTIVHTSDLMMIIRQNMYILSIITKEMGKLKTYSPTYCIMDNYSIRNCIS